MPKIGTCDVCEATEVELAYVNCCGIETWACEGCCVDRMMRKKPDRPPSRIYDDRLNPDGDYDMIGTRRAHEWGD